MRVRWLKTLLRNLDEQAEFIAQDNRQAAVRMVERVGHAVAILGQHPAMGRTGRVPLTGELMVAGTPFIVVYRVREAVEVLRVLHAAQAWPPRRRAGSSPRPRNPLETGWHLAYKIPEPDSGCG